MKAAPIVGLTLIAALLLLGGPAAAQGKDPFRPPVGSGVSGAGGGTGGAPTGGVPAVPRQPRTDGGLPRTGLDYSIPVLLAVALLAAGASMRVVTKALVP